MKWIEFCRLMQAVENRTPTKTISLIAKDYEHNSQFIKILALELDANNLASKKAFRWVVNALEVFDDEVELAIYQHGDIGEGVYHFVQDGKDSEMNLNTILHLLSMDCSKSDGQSYNAFYVAFNSMSALEKKWFLRYWLRTPRNGINNGTVRKLLAKIYDKKEAEVKKHNQLHSLQDISIFYSKGEEPPNDLKIGRYIAPMLAKAVPKEKWPKQHIVEYKYDGARYQIHFRRKIETTVIIFNRKGKVVTDKFPDIVEEILSWKIEEPFIIDTEIYPVENDGRPAPFKKMGTRIHSKNVKEAVEKCPVELAVFDCMMFNDENLMDSPLKDRINIIYKFPKQAVRSTIKEDNDIFYNLSINDGYEGIMIKDLNATYQSGKRSVAWAKYKPPRFELDVVITGARYGDGKRSSVFASYDIAVKDDNEYISVGSIGTGFSDIDLLYLTNEGKKIVSGIDDKTHKWLPRIVLEVTCDLVTRDADGNLGLRFPRMLRIRTDKPVSDINTLKDVEGMI
ncbi:MAG: putative DNA ligase [Prokaryotic dsDNA virus sp.]|nr:MAG: putative DNA ligase [Prokaryotic dsDNA virus sp.]